MGSHPSKGSVKPVGIEATIIDERTSDSIDSKGSEEPEEECEENESSDNADGTLPSSETRTLELLLRESKEKLKEAEDKARTSELVPYLQSIRTRSCVQ